MPTSRYWLQAPCAISTCFNAIASAEPLAAELAAEAPFPVRYVHEPAPGVANARNALVAAAKGELIAFLDDDEEAAPGWLAALVDAQARFGADAVFGPVEARAPATITRHREYLQRFFSREGPAAAGVIDHYYGCGDSLLRRAALPHPTRPFDIGRNQTGGEDDQLFHLMHRAGARFVWSPAALVYEDPAPGRLTLRYALALSLNNATVKVAEEVGYDKVADLARSAGITSVKATPAMAVRRLMRNWILGM